MGRTARFGKDEILVAAAREAALGRSVTVQTLAVATGASVGSLYHRFESFQQLLAETWLHAVDEFQDSFLPALRSAATAEQGVEAALAVPRWSRTHLDLAGLLVQRSQSDFIGADTPAQLRRRAVKLNADISRALSDFAARTGLEPLRCRVALIGMPYGIVRMFLPATAPPPEIDPMIAVAYHALVKA